MTAWVGERLRWPGWMPAAVAVPRSMLSSETAKAERGGYYLGRMVMRVAKWAGRVRERGRRTRMGLPAVQHL